MLVYEDAEGKWRECGTDVLLSPQPSQFTAFKDGLYADCHRVTSKPLGTIPTSPGFSLDMLPDVIHWPMRRIGHPDPIQVADVIDSISNFVGGKGVTITHSQHGRNRVVIITAELPEPERAGGPCFGPPVPVGAVECNRPMRDGETVWVDGGKVYVMPDIDCDAPVIVRREKPIA